MVNDVTIPIFYGLCALSALLLARASDRELLKRLAWVLLWNWALCNAVTVLIRFQRAPLLMPAVDTAMALCVPLVAGRSVAASIVFGLYVAVGIVHVDAFLTHTEGRPQYFLTLNLLYLAQVVTVGAASGPARLATRSRTRRLVPRMPFGHARVDASERKVGA